MAQEGPNINNISFHLKKLGKRANQIPNEQKEGNNKDQSKKSMKTENRKQYERIGAISPPYPWFVESAGMKPGDMED